MPTLDEATLVTRLESELARVQRLGGFVSVAVIGVGARADPRDLGWAAGILEQRHRTYDLIGWVGPDLVVTMPGASPGQAIGGARRILSTLSTPESATPRFAVGVATTYGEAEGGAEAVIAAARDAARGAPLGEVRPSEWLTGRPRILVVDDDRAFAQALADTIAEAEWLADPCTDGHDALERVRQMAYHGLFVDLVLPDVSGAEILGESLRCFPRRPGILMSGHDSQHALILEVLSLGPVLFVQKPIAAPALESALRMFRLLLPGFLAPVRPTSTSPRPEPEPDPVATRGASRARP